jgi:hypothetical protein
MTSQPQWSATDDTTATLLTLVADAASDAEWQVYLEALRIAAAIPDSPPDVIKPNTLRRVLNGYPEHRRVAPRRVGAFASRAVRQQLVTYTGEWQTSDDTHGRNAGKPCRVMRLNTYTEDVTA